jgi:hypothetical protein
VLTNPFNLGKPLTSSTGFYNLGALVGTVNSKINATLSRVGQNKYVAFESNDCDHFGDSLTAYLLSSMQVVQNLLNGILQLHFGQSTSDKLHGHTQAKLQDHSITMHKDAFTTKTQDIQLQWYLLLPAGILFFNMLFLITYRSRTNTKVQELSENEIIQCPK